MNEEERGEGYQFLWVSVSSMCSHIPAWIWTVHILKMTPRMYTCSLSLESPTSHRGCSVSDCVRLVSPSTSSITMITSSEWGRHWDGSAKANFKVGTASARGPEHWRVNSRKKFPLCLVRLEMGRTCTTIYLTFGILWEGLLVDVSVMGDQTTALISTYSDCQTGPRDGVYEAS